MAGMAKLVALLAVLEVIVQVDTASGKQNGGLDEYDRKCEEIVAHSRQAGQFFNSGRQAEAHKKLEDAEASFRAAKKLQPKEPQAYISIATTMLNAQRFDDSVRYWNEAAPLMPKGRAREWAAGRATWAKYGKVSTKRDTVYANGQGNLTEALKLMEQQLQIFPDFPSLHHDKATALVMISALQEDATADALGEFGQAQETSLRAWRAGLRATGASKCCESCGGVVVDWPGHLAGGRGGGLVAVDWVVDPADGQRYGGSAAGGEDEGFLDGRAFVARFEGSAGGPGIAIAGGDGLILDEAACWLFLPSSGRWAQGARNLQMLELWTGPPSPHDTDPPFTFHDNNRGQFPNGGRVAKVRSEGKVASIVQFAAVSFFHFATEVLGRLLILQRRGVLEDPEVKLLLPKVAGLGSKASGKGGKEQKGFAAEALELLAGDIIAADRAIWLRTDGPPDVRLRAKTLFYADWPLPAEPGADGSHCATPRSVLRLVRSGLMGEPSIADGAEDSRGALLFLSRAGQSMRGALKDEAKLERGLEERARSSRPPLEFVRFGQESRTLREQVALFRRARAVVGVHGGAFTNLLFSGAGTAVFELGFQSPFAGHYRHLAAAMDLRSVPLPLVADARGMGAREVELAGGGVDAALARVREALLGGSVGRDGARTQEL